MPILPTLTAPGVYVQEVEWLPPDIPAISTSITAFVGRARMGPTDGATLIGSFGDFESIFGGLWAQSPLSYAVKHFFDNGGSQAYIVRICATEAEVEALGEAAGVTSSASTLGLTRVTTAPPGNADGCARINVGPTAAAQAPGDPPTGGFQLSAANPGAWGDALRVEVDRNGITDDTEATFGVPTGSMVNITVHHAGDTERHTNVSFAESADAQRIDRVLSTSRFVRYPSDTTRIGHADALTVDGGKALAAIAELHQTTYRDPATIETPAAYLAELPAGSGGDDGYHLTDSRFFTGDEARGKGLYRLETVDIFNLLVIPRDRFDGPDVKLDHPAVFNFVDRREAFWILDVPRGELDRWDDMIVRGQPGLDTVIADTFGNPGALGRNAAVFYPDLIFPDPLQGQKERRFGPAGAVAGIFARTDTARGVWKAPAGTEATVIGVQGLTAQLNDVQNGTANERGINCFRAFNLVGTVLWGSRTLRGDQRLDDQDKYIPVRRLGLYIEASLRRGLQWTVFEPNTEALWATIRDRIGDFMTGLMRQGALFGATARDAFFVQCGLGATMTPQDVSDGICRVTVSYAPIRQAEFATLSFVLMTAGSQG